MHGVLPMPSLVSEVKCPEADTIVGGNISILNQHISGHVDIVGYGDSCSVAAATLVSTCTSLSHARLVSSP